MKTLTTSLLICLCCNSAYAAGLTIPKSFSANTPAVAADVNANFLATKAAVDDNNVRINTNSASIAALGGAVQVVRDSDSSVVGKLLSTDNRSWTTLNQQGYLVELTADGRPSSELVYFTNNDCTGTAYLLVNANGGTATIEQANPMYAKQGYVFKDFLDIGVYYVAKNTPTSSCITHNSRILSSSCQATTATIDAVQASSNIPAITAVPNAGYGAVSLQ